ncbi:hypothetical protein [Pseudomonas sp.]|uniref:hypothetical protein n=1 Tax=Pseudomonas sp. TaxID=306 RepID=UPI002590EE80|nr:hypothetical protein [Pseudomonas sp.]
MTYRLNVIYSTRGNDKSVRHIAVSRHTVPTFVRPVCKKLGVGSKALARQA